MLFPLWGNANFTCTIAYKFVFRTKLIFNPVCQVIGTS